MSSTEFASAELSSEDELKQHIALFSKSKLPLIDLVSDVVLALNKNRQIVFANQAVVTTFRLPDIDAAYGLRPGELIDCIHAYEGCNGCGTTKFCSECGAIKSILSSLTGKEDIQECRIIQNKSGKAVDLRVSTHSVTLEDELFVIFIARDIGDEKMRTVFERLFLHDITNTITSVLSFLELVPESDATMKDRILTKIFKSNIKLLNQIDAHRELIAAEANELPVHPDVIDSMNLLDDILNTYKESDITEGYGIVIASDSKQVELISDKVILHRVLSNVVKNALEASDKDDVITLKSVKVGRRVRFSVHNPGYISRNVQLQIFQRSFSTKGAGRGLGTYSIRLFSERYLQGKVWFTSSRSKGTTFFLSYPLKPK